MRLGKKVWVGLFAFIAGMMAVAAPAAAQQQRPNIVFIMGDDIGWANIGVYNQGIMAGRTPNLDQLAAEGCASPTITPRQVARPVGQISSPGRYLSALV